jgi:hypothetical protein
MTRHNTLKISTLQQYPGKGDVFLRGLLERGMISPGKGDDRHHKPLISLKYLLPKKLKNLKSVKFFKTTTALLSLSAVAFIIPKKVSSARHRRAGESHLTCLDLLHHP